MRRKLPLPFPPVPLIALSVVLWSSVVRAESYRYDSLNRLTEVRRDGDRTTLTYDAAGNLAQVCRGVACEELVVDESGGLAQVVARVASRGAIAVSRGPHGAIATRTEDGATWYPLRDHTSTPRAYLRGNDQLGRVVYEPARRAAFDVYGAPRITPDVPREAIEGFTGELPIEEGALWLRSRVYLTEEAAFAQRDTFDGTVPAPGLNRYSYAHGNPVLYTDRTGHSPILDVEIYDGTFVNRLPDFQDTFFSNPSLPPKIKLHALDYASGWDAPDAPTSGSIVRTIWGHGSNRGIIGQFGHRMNADDIAAKMSAEGVQSLFLMTCKSCLRKPYSDTLAGQVLLSSQNRTLTRASGSFTGFETASDAFGQNWPDVRPRSIDPANKANVIEGVFHELELDRATGTVRRIAKGQTAYQIMDRLVAFDRMSMGVVPFLGIVGAGTTMQQSSGQYGWQRRTMMWFRYGVEEAWPIVGIAAAATEHEPIRNGLAVGGRHWASGIGYHGL